MTKYKRLRYGLFAALLAPIVCCLCCMSYSTAFADSSEKIDVSSETKTMYYLELPTKGLTGYCQMYPRENTNNVYNKINAYLQSATDTSYPLTFQFVFNNCCVNGNPLMVTWRCEVTATPRNSNQMWRSSAALGEYVNFAKFVFDTDIRVNVRKEYFDILVSGDYTDFSVTHLYDGNGYLMYNDNMCDYYDNEHNNAHLKHIYHNLDGIKTVSEEVPDNYDPIIDEGQAPDNGGFLSTVVGFFGGSTGGLPNWAYIALGAVGVVLLIILIRVGIGYLRL